MTAQEALDNLGGTGVTQPQYDRRLFETLEAIVYELRELRELIGEERVGRQEAIERVREAIER